MRVIAHVDMNAFFAAIEQRCNPALRGRPVAVCGSGRRTIVSAASYEARACGVKAGMTPVEAVRLCPGLILVPGNWQKYACTSTGIMKIFKRFSPTVEVFSVDEAFMDLTSTAPLFHGPRQTASLIKADILQQTGLTCSIGIAPNKLLAKLGSDLEKPDGLVVITAATAPALLERLPVDSLCGIGPSTASSLRLLGIRTCGQLGCYPLNLLKQRFGSAGERLHLMGLGLDDLPVVPAEQSPEAKSFGHCLTLPYDLEDHSSLLGYLLQLSQATGRRMRSAGACGRTLTLTVRYNNFQTVSRRRSFYPPVNHSLDIFPAARDIFLSMRHPLPIRLLGVSLSGISRNRQLSLLPESRRRHLAQKAMDDANNRYGENAVVWGATVRHTIHEPPISPAWRPTQAGLWE